MNSFGPAINSTSIFRGCADVNIDNAYAPFSRCDPAQGGAVERALGANMIAFAETQHKLQGAMQQQPNSHAAFARAQSSMSAGTFVPLGLSNNGLVNSDSSLFSTPLSQLPGGY